MHTICGTIVVIAAIACGRNSAVHPLDYEYTPDQLSADVARLRDAIEEGDPTIRRMRSQREIDSIFVTLETAVSRPLRALDFWREVTRAVAGLGDAHLTVLPNQSIFTAIYQDPGAAVPLVFRIDGDRLYVRRTYLGEAGPPAGSEVLSVNGMSANAFVAVCTRHVSVDGHAFTRAHRRIEREFEQTCGPVHGLPAEYMLSYRAPGDSPTSTRTATVRAVSWAERRRLLRATFPGDTMAPPSGEFRVLDRAPVAVLTLRTFVKTDAFDPGQFIERAFEQLRGASVASLIIDLRGNTGGRDTYAATLYRHIAPDTFTYYARRLLNKKRFEFLEGTDDWFINYLTLVYPPMRERSDGGYELRMAMDRPMRPTEGAFGGRVFLLVDGNTFSVGPEFAALFRHKQRGVILGDEMATVESGGSGAVMSLTLSNTRLIVNVPIVSIQTHRPNDLGIQQRGMMPDVGVPVTIEDLLAGRDPVMEAALRLAGGRPDARDGR